MNDYASRSGGMNGWTRDRNGDLPYWHKREMTNIGFLAAAAWRLGGVTIQEFEVTRPQDKKGWGDLWIKLDQLGCHIEAKGANPSSISREAVDDLIAEAETQFILPENEKADIGVAACFVVPAVKQAFDFRGFARQFEGDHNLVAVYMPSRDLDTQYNGDDYPGLALIGKTVWSHITNK